ncbi:hypothetical protein D3C73_1406540 [compost metagenome]
MELTSDENPATLLEHLNTHSYIKNIRIEENSLYITVEDHTRDFARTNTILNENHIDFCAVEIQKPSLSDIFMKFTNEEEVE